MFKATRPYLRLFAFAMCLTASPALAAPDMRDVAEVIVKLLDASLREHPMAGDTLRVLAFTDQRGNESNAGEQLTRALTARLAGGNYAFEAMGPYLSSSESNDRDRTGQTALVHSQTDYLVAGEYACDETRTCTVTAHLKRRARSGENVERGSACVKFNSLGEIGTCAGDPGSEPKHGASAAQQKHTATCRGIEGWLKVSDVHVRHEGKAYTVDITLVPDPYTPTAVAMVRNGVGTRLNDDLSQQLRFRSSTMNNGHYDPVHKTAEQHYRAGSPVSQGRTFTIRFSNAAERARSVSLQAEMALARQTPDNRYEAVGATLDCRSIPVVQQP